jgi:polyisoprenoid-binding protein YceI
MSRGDDVQSGRFSIVLVALFVSLLGVSNFHEALAQTTPGYSTITIHVHKAGVFSAFGHNHEITAPVVQVNVDAKAMSADIVVHAADLKVLDTDLSDKDRASVQQTMLGPKVLDAEKFPEIRFKSSRIEQTAPQHFRVMGTLELHGVKKPITFDMTGGPQEYKGNTRLKQTEFGIEPVSAGGGTVKVKNEIELEMDIYAGEPRHGSR